MNEEETKRKEEEEAKAGSEQGTESNSDKGNKYETTPVIERARQEREKMEAATAAQKIENDRTEQIMAKKALGGVTEAGQDQQKPKEQTPLEYMKEVMDM